MIYNLLDETFLKIYKFGSFKNGFWGRRCITQKKRKACRLKTYVDLSPNPVMIKLFPSEVKFQAYRKIVYLWWSVVSFYLHSLDTAPKPQRYTSKMLTINILYMGSLRNVNEVYCFSEEKNLNIRRGGVQQQVGKLWLLTKFFLYSCQSFFA